MAKKGERYQCEKCGVVVAVEEDCGCAVCDLICCDVPMKKVTAPAKKAKKK
ncbi:MAG: hypothetical protein ACP5PX_00310 [Candidatus Hadarchaeum sp.]|uniref:hypothetical protein n=1 Tax=Candidatus Hadarchaeum sp. TaxID=2883567 RepID=UPI003D0D05E8